MLVLSGCLFVFLYLSSDKYIALVFTAMLGFLFATLNGAIFSAIQSLVNDSMHSVGLALVFLLANLIGFGLGPITAGVLSDLLAPRFEQESLRYALLLLSPGYLLPAYCYWKASHTIEADIRSVESQAASAESADTEFTDKELSL